MVDNRSIVPYNSYFSSKYRAHINVEAVISLTATKYITKYTHKGPDRARIELFTGDEVSTYLNSRYISASEAVWCLLEFPLHKQIPDVVRLQVRIPHVVHAS